MVNMQHFTGREKSLQLLKRRVIDLKEGYRQNVAILGAECIGKSTLLQRFILSLDDESVVPIYLDLQNKDVQYFFSKFTRSLLYQFAKRRKLPLQEDLALLMEQTKEFIPGTVKMIQEISDAVDRQKYDSAYRKMMTVTSLFSRESNMFCVLMLDEFHVLEEFGLPEVFSILGDQIMTQKKCLYVFTSSYTQVAEKILNEKLSLLFGNFETLTLKGFDFHSSQILVDTILDDVKIGLQLKNFLIDFTGGHPLYLAVLTEQVKHLSAIHHQREVYIPILSQAIENIVFNQWGALSRHFELMMNKFSDGAAQQDVPSLLMALSNGTHKVSTLVSDLRMKSSQVKRRLKMLIQKDVVEKNGSYYHLNDKLFRYWVKYVYQKRLCSLELEPGRHRVNFKEDIQEAIAKFQLNSGKDLSARVVDLLHCFDDETLQLDGRKYRLPTVHSVEPLQTRQKGHAFDVLQATTDQGMWYLVLKKDSFLEQELNDFLKQTKSFEEKPRRCVLVSMADLDENARVRALEERMWIWNEGEINTLMQLFDKPYVM